MLTSGKVLSAEKEVAHEMHEIKSQTTEDNLVKAFSVPHAFPKELKGVITLFIRGVQMCIFQLELNFGFESKCRIMAKESNVE